MPRCQNVCLQRNVNLVLITVLKTFSVMPTHRVIFVASFIEIPPLSKEILHHAKQMLTDRQLEDVIPSPTIVQLRQKTQSQGMRSPCFFRETPTPWLENSGLQTPALKKFGLLQLRL